MVFFNIQTRDISEPKRRLFAVLDYFLSTILRFLMDPDAGVNLVKAYNWIKNNFKRLKMEE